MSFDRGDRIYYVSDERLRAFGTLSTEEKLRWVEELATFIRLTRESADHGARDNPAPSLNFSVRT